MARFTDTPKTAQESAEYTAWQRFFASKTHKIMLTEKQLAGWIEAGIKTHEAAQSTRVTETAAQIRDRLLPFVYSYAAAEGLTERGTVQAALRFGAEAGIKSANTKES